MRVLEKQDWIFILAIVALVLVTILRVASKVSEANLMQVVMFVLGMLIGGGVVYARLRERNERTRDR